MLAAVLEDEAGVGDKVLHCGTHEGLGRAGEGADPGTESEGSVAFVASAAAAKIDAGLRETRSG
jgi:hypothetical protein